MQSQAFLEILFYLKASHHPHQRLTAGLDTLGQKKGGFTHNFADFSLYLPSTVIVS